MGEHRWLCHVRCIMSASLSGAQRIYLPFPQAYRLMAGGSAVYHRSDFFQWIIVCTHVSEQVCYHTGSETEPDERDKQKDRGDIDILSRYIARCFPGLVPTPAVVESCLYTVSRFIAHPQVLSLVKICRCVSWTKLSFDFFSKYISMSDFVM